LRAELSVVPPGTRYPADCIAYIRAERRRPADCIAYIGPSAGEQNVYIATGFAADGLTYGSLAKVRPSQRSNEPRQTRRRRSARSLQ